MSTSLDTAWDKWRNWRLELEDATHLEYVPWRDRALEAAAETPMLSREILEDYSFRVEYSQVRRVFIASCWEMPGFHWRSTYSAHEAIVGLFRTLDGVIASVNYGMVINPLDPGADDVAKEMTDARTALIHDSPTRPEFPTAEAYREYYFPEREGGS